MCELRPHVNKESFISRYDRALSMDECTIVGAFELGNCIALMGYRILYDYAHGKNLYIDDLVTSEAHRSKGLGKKLMEFAEKEAERLGCSYIRLCTGVNNTGARKFYERYGLQSPSVVYKKKLK